MIDDFSILTACNSGSGLTIIYKLVSNVIIENGSHIANQANKEESNIEYDRKCFRFLKIQ